MNYDEWRSTEPDDRYNYDGLIATCDRCHCEFIADDDERECRSCAAEYDALGPADAVRRIVR